jgi:hypothetical protein
MNSNFFSKWHKPTHLYNGKCVLSVKTAYKGILKDMAILHLRACFRIPQVLIFGLKTYKVHNDTNHKAEIQKLHVPAALERCRYCCF